MTEQRYGIEVAKLILKNCCGDYVEFTKEGVFVKQEYVHAWLEPTEAFAWTAACEMDWADAPDPLTYPALPVDFSSQELAAFLLDGVGLGMVATEYGDFSDGPDEDSLDHFGIRGGKARRALKDAYANLRTAMNKVGYPNMALLQQEEAIRRQYHEARGESLEREKVMEPNHAGLPESEYMAEYRRRLGLAIGPLAELEREMERLTAEADASRKRWRKAMVAALLKPVTNPAEPELESTTKGASVVQPEGIDPTMLATREQLIEAFGTFTGMDASWFNNLKDTPKLLAARKVTGQGGRNYAAPLFCPHEVMLWLVNPKRRKGKPMKQETGWRVLEHRFSRVFNARSVGDPRQD